MIYANHNLRADLQTWKARLYKATYSQFGNQLKYLLNNLDNNIQILGLINEAKAQFDFTNDFFDDFTEMHNRGAEMDFKNEVHQASFSYLFLKYMIKEAKSHNLHNLIFFQSRDYEGTKSKIIEDYISPLLYYIHDRLDKSNSVIYLLEKYKRRTEWFTKKELFNNYSATEKNYEQILEDDLRLFLFDQGIEYPFSTPLSASGRADIVGEIDTEDPLIVEIKIFDRTKNYGKDRIKDGFHQILKYANDYNKDIGFLIIYNMDKAQLNLSFNNDSNIFPPSIKFNNKTFYFVIINSANLESASKSGVIQEIEIKESELTRK